MAYKTCPNCGSRIFEHGCVNCNEIDYISMQQEYSPLNNSTMNTTPRKYYEAALDMPAGGGATTPSSKKLTPMTIEDVIKNKMTWEDVMKKYKPDISSDEANYILWNETCYPFDAETTLSHIHAYFTNNYQQ